MTNYAYLEDESDEYILELFYVRVTLIILYTIVFFLCVFGNLIVLIVVTIHWRMRNRLTKFCLANLALADLCVGIFCVYQNLSTYFIDNWILGDFLCKMYLFINGTSHTASILTLVAVCVEQYFAVITPLKFKQILTKTHLKVLVVGVWLVSGLYCSPRLYYLGTIVIPLDMNMTETETICAPQRQYYDSQVLDVVNSIFLFMVPLVLMTVLYTRVGLVLWGNAGNQIPRSTAVATRSLFSDEGSTVTETFGISPHDRIIERPIGNLPRTFHAPRHSKGSRSPNSPTSITPSQFRRRLTDLSPCSLGVRSNLYCTKGLRGRVGHVSKPRTGVFPTQLGMNGLRRTYFLKKIQAQKQLQMKKSILQGKDELK
ncbi:unnamed protein product, partial [Allacma fusca]